MHIICLDKDNFNMIWTSASVTSVVELSEKRPTSFFFVDSTGSENLGGQVCSIVAPTIQLETVSQNLRMG